MIDKAKYINIYLDYHDKNLKQTTIKGKLKVIRQFLDYCIINEIEDIKHIEKTDVYNFVNSKDWASDNVLPCF